VLLAKENYWNDRLTREMAGGIFEAFNGHPPVNSSPWKMIEVQLCHLESFEHFKKSAWIMESSCPYVFAPSPGYINSGWKSWE
jgi:hypothetical protein